MLVSLLIGPNGSSRTNKVIVNLIFKLLIMIRYSESKLVPIAIFYTSKIE